MISTESVEKACSQVGQFTDEQMASEFDRFFQTQPAVCDFIVDLTHESGQKIQELCLFLSYMVFKTLEAAEAHSAGTVKPEDIEAAYRETESWVTRVSQVKDTDLQGAIAESLQRDTEPYLLHYVI